MSQRSRRGLATWLTGSTTPLFVLNERRVVLVFNRGLAALTQWDAADVIGKACHYQAEGFTGQVESLTGALCPPAQIHDHECTIVRGVIPCRDGTLLDREIHFFPLPTDDPDGKLHLLGIVCPPSALPAPPSRHYEVAQHLADLARRYGVDRFVAKSPEMRRVAAQIEIGRMTTAAVHLTGQQGVGKEHLARLIHYHGVGGQLRFVPLRCAGSSHFELRRTLLRLAEQADDAAAAGTIYLDLVEYCPRDLQELVLGLIERGPYRWMSSSVAGLEQLSEEAFSPELRAGLTSLLLQIPPLVERGDDLLLLAQQILEESNRQREVQLEGFTPAVERLFLQYPWPGNVAELARTIERGVERATGPLIDVTDLPFEFTAGMQAQEIRPVAEVVGKSLDGLLLDFERQEIERVLGEVKGNKSLAAEKLGIPRAKLYRRLSVLGLESSQADPSSSE